MGRMKFIPQEQTHVCDGCWNCCEHCECGPNGKPSPCDIKLGKCSKCSPSKSEHPSLRYFKLHEKAFAPHWGTNHAACFDLCACLIIGDTVNVYSPHNEKSRKVVSRKMDDERGYVLIAPGERVMIPTGLIFDIPLGYSVRLHSRSGIALKQGLVLANHEGVIDSDYVDPTFVVLTNVSLDESYIFHGDRIAQGEMIPDLAYSVEETTTQPQQKSDRAGGFGSTGKN